MGGIWNYHSMFHHWKKKSNFSFIGYISLLNDYIEWVTFELLMTVSFPTRMCNHVNNGRPTSYGIELQSLTNSTQLAWQKGLTLEYITKRLSHIKKTLKNSKCIYSTHFTYQYNFIRDIKQNNIVLGDMH